MILKFANYLPPCSIFYLSVCIIFVPVAETVFYGSQRKHY